MQPLVSDPTVGVVSFHAKHENGDNVKWTMTGKIGRLTLGLVDEGD
jgi:hypothetical protein